MFVRVPIVMISDYTSVLNGYGNEMLTSWHPNSDLKCAAESIIQNLQ